jgi:putative sugar O-methyltransferase
MNKDSLNMKELLKEYKNSPKEFHVTSYWASYEKRVLETISSIDIEQLRSGKYPVLATFGFNDAVYTYHPNLPLWKKIILKFIHRFIIKDRPVLPYKLQTKDIQEMAYHHCKIMGDLTKAHPIDSIEASEFGNPQDIFEINGRKYTMPFLSFYRRYCFANKNIDFKGDEVIVELGSGSGYQIEVLKKMYPNITVLCFDLPSQLYLCQQYLSGALGKENIIGTETTIKWNDISNIQKGGIHFFGNWQLPMLQDFQYDIFWNAASFGEMEPKIVENYLSFIKGNANWIYLLQARHGKETSGKAQVIDPITLEDYKNLLKEYDLQDEGDAWHAHKRLSQSGGYFEGIWKKNN